MKRSVFLIAVILALMLGMAVLAAMSSAQAGVPGITSADTMPRGCVDCHKRDAQRDFSLPTILRATRSHARTPVNLLDELKDCYSCHKKPGEMANLMHATHYKGGTNQFITVYSGYCTWCHGVDTKTGAVTIKGK